MDFIDTAKIEKINKPYLIVNKAARIATYIFPIAMAASRAVIFCKFRFSNSVLAACLAWPMATP
jgi:hypothetical protein